MTRVFTKTLIAALAAVLLAGGFSRSVEAETSSTLMALAAPLAQQFGVPESAVSMLFDKGVSLESVTQLLLISQDSGKELDSVAQLYRDSKSDVSATAKQLEVASSVYSEDKVESAIDRAREQVTADAADKVDDANRQAADEANKAVGSALGNLSE